MTYEQWKEEVAAAFGKLQGSDIDYGREFIRQSGDDCWRQKFEDGEEPADAARDEHEDCLRA